MMRCLPCARVVPVAALTLALTGGLPARAADAPAGATLADTLGVPVDKAPVRERTGWRPPRIVLVAPYVHDHLALLQTAVPQAKLVEMPAASARDIANADVTIGVCSEDVLSRHASAVDSVARRRRRALRAAASRSERHLILTNLQRIAAPEHGRARHRHDVRLQPPPRLLLQGATGGSLGTGRRPDASDLEGKTLLVVGLGGIGTEVAKRAHALGMRVIATRASGRNGPDYVSYVGLPDELLKLAAEADFVVNCTPLTPQTTGLFDQAFFQALKPSAYFLNVGRGKSVVTVRPHRRAQRRQARRRGPGRGGPGAAARR